MTQNTVIDIEKVGKISIRKTRKQEKKFTYRCLWSIIGNYTTSKTLNPQFAHYSFLADKDQKREQMNWATI